MNLREQASLLLFWSTLYLQTPDGYGVTASDTTSTIRLEKLWSVTQTKPRITVSVSLGNATELRCRNETSEGSVMWWQTPFGSFGGTYKFSNKDPIEMISGNLRISKVMFSHTGLYSCHLVDSIGTTVIPYRVNVLSENTHETGTRMRTAREAVKSTIYYSDTDLVAAVTSSVLISFIGAFTLGALSQPYVMKCLQRARARICPNKRSRRHTTTVSNPRTVFFRRNPNSEEETAEVSIQVPSIIKTDRDESQLEGNSNSTKPTSNELTSDESDQTKDPEEEIQKSEPITRTQPKRVSRVIKLYNYDEDGNRYSHIKEPEDNPTARQRVMSLTRLQSIMNEVETDSTEPDEALTVTLDI